MASRVLLFTYRNSIASRSVAQVLEFICSDKGIPFQILTAPQDKEEFKKYGIDGVPIIVALVNEQEVGRLIGVQNMNSIKAKFKDWGIYE